jgi:predicted transcriptional regulator
MAPRTGNRRGVVVNRLSFVQRTDRDLKRRVDALADSRNISTNAFINELLEKAVDDDELERAA